MLKVKSFVVSLSNHERTYISSLLISTTCLLFISSNILAADYLLLGNPSAYTIYNQYEQQLTDAEKKALPANSPFEIIAENDRLGDQITPVLRTKSNGQTLCFLLDENGKMAGEKNNRYHQRVQNCTVINKDAVTHEDLTITSPETANNITCKKGTALKVLFKSNTRYYVISSGTTPRYGWIKTDADISYNQISSVATVQISPSVRNPLTPVLRQTLSSRIETANRMYRSFFSAFNSSTGQGKTIPAWKLQSTDTLEIHWILCDPYKHNGVLDNSTKLLIEDLKKIIAGKQLSIQQNSGEIVIRTNAP